MRNLWSLYHEVLNKYPLRTQMVQTGIILSLGDIISQRLLSKKSEIDPVSVLRFGAIGTFFVAPSVRMWYITLERAVGSTVSKRITLTKVALDQGLFAPIFSASFISANSVLLGRSINEIKEELRSKYVDIVLNGWKIWPMAQLLNFYFVPFLLRPLFVSTVALFWNSYLAWKIN